MAGRIPSSFIDDLIARSDIVEIVDSRVKLKKAGRNYQACCPFHNEKTPSFSVSQEKQFYYCFGCGAKGNAISFIMEYERLDFVEAVEDLAKQYGLEVPREKGGTPLKSQEQRNEREQDYELMGKVARYFEYQLKHHKNAPQIIDYLKNRGLSGKVVKHWGIGYAPQEWDALLSKFGNDAPAVERLLALKVVNQNDNKRRYDFFRHRVMFPIHDKRGRVVAFGGRIIDDEGPKYLNSPETRIFHKSYELYGLYQSRQANRKLERLMVVEGYMDVVALSQFGIDYSVAALGTATTPDHIQTLFKSTSEVVCCYDGDRAGREAAWRALENALPFLQDGKIMKFLFLPDGEDPDSMVRKIGKEAFETLISEAKPLSGFFFDALIKKHSIASIEGMAALKAEAMPLIKQILGENQRTMMMAQLKKVCKEGDGHDYDADTKHANKHRKIKRTDYKSPANIVLSPLRMIIRLLLESPRLASSVDIVNPHSLSVDKISGLSMLLEIYDYCLRVPNANTASLFEAFREHPHIHHLSKLFSAPIEDNIDLEAEYIACFSTLVKWQVNARLDELMAKQEFELLTQDEVKEITALLLATDS
ncbi:DNA primase [Glaciecola punicea ACAM 611]|jgi:DNA primase|uniref:DNA primase n=1 Tax=Glaciecola punicea ACAM 611 TaxID=1121923 RepID=H5TED2_9ALTE|nr:DNA primase [Glaciecola punicea]OFA32356.1 DNA primase [Glaciecola punicea]GAB56659.1 DNA primase [Glaciecola punicea ACAM 611]